MKQDLLQHNVVLEEFGGNVLSRRDLGQEGHRHRAAARADPAAGGNPRPQGQRRAPRRTAPCSRPRSTRARARSPRSWSRRARCTSATTSSAASSPAACARCSTSAGKTVKEAGPSIPVQILGFEGVPTAGDSFGVVADAAEARDIAQRRQRLEREAQSRRTQQGLEPRGLQPAAQGRRGHAAPHHHQGRPGRPGRSAGRRAGAAQHQRSAGRGRPPRRRRDHRERRPARQGVGRHHPRLPRAARLQRPHGGRARTVDVAPTASSTRRWKTCATRSRACSSPRRRKWSSARPRCASCSRSARSARSPAASCGAA